MTIKIADRVQQTTTTSGTGALNLISPAASDRSFVAALGSGTQCPYVIDDGAGNWEIGLGTITSGTPDVLARDTVYKSSNGDALVNFPAGLKTVVIDLPSAWRLWTIDTFGAGDVPIFDGAKFVKQSTTGTGAVVRADSPTFTTKLTGPDAGFWDATGIVAKMLSADTTVAGSSQALSSINRSSSSSAINVLSVANDIFNGATIRVFSSTAAESWLSGPNGAGIVNNAGKLVLGTVANYPVSLAVNSTVVATLNANGLGVGTTPSYPLHVYSSASKLALFEGSGNANYTFDFDLTAGYQFELAFRDGGTQKFGLGKNIDNSFYIYDNARTNFSFQITSSGGLQLASASGQSVDVIAGGSGGVTLASGATAWAAISELHLKTNFQPVLNAVERINAHKIEFWNYKTDPDGAPVRAGMFYEDACEHWPVAAMKDADGTGRVAGSAYTPLLMAAVQEMSRAMEAMQLELHELKGRLNERGM